MSKPKTNRDVINAMSDEELARWKLDFSVPNVDSFCRVWWKDAKPCSENCKCKDCLAEWLKAPAGKHQEVEND